MKLTIKKTGKLFKTTFTEWWNKDPFKESAVIAYYAIFSLPGLLVVIITIAGYFFGNDTVHNHLSSQITTAMGEETANQIQEIIVSASKSKNSVWATIIGVTTILVGATGVFAQFQKSLNMIWEVKVDESKSNFWELIKVRLFSFGLIVAIAFIMMVSFVVNTMLIAMGDWLSGYFSNLSIVVIQILNFLLSCSIIVVVFALMFKIFPDAKIKWSHVWMGSCLTTILFLVGMYSMSLYFSQLDPGSGYGAAGSIILILLWTSYSSMIVFFGAEFTNAYAKLQDGTIPPEENAVVCLNKDDD